MVMVTISLVFARVLVELFDIYLLKHQVRFIMVTVDPSVVVFKTAEPRFSLHRKRLLQRPHLLHEWIRYYTHSN